MEKYLPILPQWPLCSNSTLCNRYSKTFQKFSKSINFLVKLVLLFLRHILAWGLLAILGMASLHSFAELLQRNWSYLKQKGRGKDHSNVVVRVYFWQAEICVFINTGPKTCGAFSSTLLTECQGCKVVPRVSPTPPPPAERLRWGRREGWRSGTHSQPLTGDVSGNPLMKGKVYRPPTPRTVSSVNCFPREKRKF